MSFWAKIKTTINDLDAFKRTCDKHNIECVETGGKYRNYDVHSELRHNGTTFGHLIKDGGGFRVALDRDANYRRTAKHIGNGDILTRDYAVDVAENSIVESGGEVVDRIYNADGSIVLKCVSY